MAFDRWKARDGSWNGWVVTVGAAAGFIFLTVFYHSVTMTPIQVLSPIRRVSN